MTGHFIFRVQRKIPMQSSLYVSLSGQVALQKRLDTIANNIANANTGGYRAEEVKGSRATSRAFFTAMAMSRWCCTQLPVTRRAQILPRSLM